jgi:hypothetical protein
VSQPTRAEITKIGDAVNSLALAVAQSRTTIEFLQADSADSKRILEKIRDQIQQVHAQVAVLQASQADLTKRWDESDRRRWTVYGVMLAAGLALSPT